MKTWKLIQELRFLNRQILFKTLLSSIKENLLISINKIIHKKGLTIHTMIIKSKERILKEKDQRKKSSLLW